MNDRPTLKPGARFCAYPGRQVMHQGVWLQDPPYKVTAVRRGMVFYTLAIDPGNHGSLKATQEYLEQNGLRVIAEDGQAWAEMVRLSDEIIAEVIAEEQA